MKKKVTAILTAAAVCMSFAACDTEAAEERTHYTIDAALSGDHVLTATVKCDYVNNTDVPLDELWFNLYPNAFRRDAAVSPISESNKKSVYINGASYSVMEISEVCVNGTPADITVAGTDQNVLTVPLGAAIDPTEHATVDISYTVQLPNISHRFGYTDKATNLGNFYPIACVYRDGSFVADPYYATGDPFYSECADYTVTMCAPEGYKGAFTGRVTCEETADGVTKYCVSAENVRDFAAVLGEFEKVSGLAGTTTVSYYYYSDSDPAHALGVAIDAVNTFGELFGEYPYPEYSVVQTSFFHGGMEYPALSMISDRYAGAHADDAIVHETAHQWWYSAVGNDEVKHPWLDEGLAEYSTMMFYEKNDGYGISFNSKRADALAAYIMYCETYKNNGLGDTSMTRALNEYCDETEYQILTYVKGAIMLDDIRNTVGTEAFIAGLKDYYSSKKFRIAQPQDLIGCMEKASKRRLDGLFESWLNGGVKLFSTN